MKSILFFASLTIVSQIYCQNIHDTLYFRKGDNDSNFRLVFIDSSKSHFHKKAIELLTSDIDYKEKLSGLGALKLISSNKFRTQFLGEWLSVYQYKGKTYAYYASEPYFNVYMKITDSTITLNDFNEGLKPYAIKEVLCRNNTCRYKMISESLEDAEITIVRKNKSIEIRSPLFNKQSNQLVDKETFLRIPIIVNLCPNDRCEEFQFK